MLAKKKSLMSASLASLADHYRGSQMRLIALAGALLAIYRRAAPRTQLEPSGGASHAARTLGIGNCRRLCAVLLLILTADLSLVGLLRDVSGGSYYARGRPLFLSQATSSRASRATSSRATLPATTSALASCRATSSSRSATTRSSTSSWAGDGPPAWCGVCVCGSKTRRVVIVAGHHSLAVTRERGAGDFIGVTRQRGVELTPAAAFADRMVGSPPPSRLQAESWWLYLLLFIFACHVSSFLALPCLHLQDMQYKKIAVCIMHAYEDEAAVHPSS